MVRRVPVQSLVEVFVPGSGAWSWDSEKADLLDWDFDKMVELKRDIQKHGITEPVLLGDDGRVWDGHHRIVVAMELGIKVPIRFSGEEEYSPEPC